MKELLAVQGGYPREMDYLLNLQSELLTLGNGLFSALGVDMVLAGCLVHNNNNGTINISQGLVYLSLEVLRFDGANNVAIDGTKTFVKSAYTTTDPKLFADGSSKNVYRQAKAVIGNSTDGNLTQIKISANIYNLKQYIQDAVQSYEVVGTIKELYDLDGTFLDNFDVSGLGITPKWNKWALDNGNNGTPGSAGKVLVAAGKYTDPVSGEETIYNEQDSDGERLHKLTIAEMPSHGHNMGADIYKNKNEGTTPPAGADGQGNRGKTDNTGGDEAHNNMQPWIGVYRVVKIL